MNTIWPHELDLELTSIAQGGAAVGRYEGRVVFAHGGLPGEHVRVRLYDRQKSFANGTVSQIYQAAPERVDPRDATAHHADWQHIEYAAQLRFKQQIVREQLAHLGGLGSVDVAPTIAAPDPWGYRNSATLHGDGQGQLGYYAPGTRRVIDRDHDPLLRSELNAALRALRAALAASQDTLLREATLRVGSDDGAVLGVVQGTGNLRALAERWAAELPSLGGVVARRKRIVEGLYGAPALHERVAGVKLRVGATSFFQVHSAQAETMVQQALAWLAPRRGLRVIDAYCGVGTFALPLALWGAGVVGVEEQPEALDDARWSAARLGGDVELRQGKVEDVLETLDGAFDAILVDPPRRGCEPATLAAIRRLAPQRVVYVACHPGTLARDLQKLTHDGFRVVLVQPIDMFPQTHHIEAMVLLER
jgi:23S rRNA (uracil1939-C5)-methyltransferase